VLDGVLGHDPVPAEDDDPVADQQRLVDVVGDKDDRAAGGLPGLDQQLLRSSRVRAAGCRP
jgi:hypothetical protein